MNKSEYVSIASMLTVFEAFSHFGGTNTFITVAAMVVFALQVLFVINFFYSMYRGKKMTTQNPYNATTLEWTSPIEHIHGNWPGELPTTHRWAYDYGKDGIEFIPQTTPLREGEIDGGGH